MIYLLNMYARIVIDRTEIIEYTIYSPKNDSSVSIAKHKLKILISLTRIKLLPEKLFPHNLIANIE